MANRLSLPQNYLLNNGTVFEEFGTLSDWTATNGTIAEDTTFVKTGTKAVRFTGTTSVTNAYMVKTISANLSNLKNISIMFYVHDITLTSTVIIRLSSLSSFSKYMEFGCANLHAGWNLVRFSQSEALNSGGESWDNTMTKLRIQSTGLPGVYPTITFDQIILDIDAVPKICISFDGGGTALYNRIYPITAPLGIKCTNYVQLNQVGDTVQGVMTWEQHDELYNAGWDMCNHTYTHPDMTTLDYDAQYTELKICDDALASRGYAFNRRCHMAPPQNRHDANTQLALRALGYKTLRAGITGFIPYPAETELFDINIKEIGNTTTMASVYSAIDKCLLNKSSLHIFTHGIMDSAPSEYYMLTSDFKAMLNYIRSKRIDVITMSEWYEGMTNPRKPIHRI